MNTLLSLLKRFIKTLVDQVEEVVEIRNAEEALRIIKNIEEKYSRLGYTIDEVCNYAEDYVDPHLNLNYIEAFNDCHTYIAAKEYLHTYSKEKQGNQPNLS